MKKISSLLLLLLCNIVCLQAQENRIVELEKSLEIIRTDPVSYTHLTLPTNSLV